MSPLHIVVVATVYCRPVSKVGKSMAWPASVIRAPVGNNGLTVDQPIRSSCRAVLTCSECQRNGKKRKRLKYTLLMYVGRTSAEGMEKSQYLWNVFGAGSVLYRIQKADKLRSTSRPMMMTASGTVYCVRLAVEARTEGCTW